MKVVNTFQKKGRVAFFCDNGLTFVLRLTGKRTIAGLKEVLEDGNSFIPVANVDLTQGWVAVLPPAPKVGLKGKNVLTSHWLSRGLHLFKVRGKQEYAYVSEEYFTSMAHAEENAEALPTISQQFFKNCYPKRKRLPLV